MFVVVVGARGQLGRALMEALRRCGHRVTGWDMPDADITRPSIAGDVAALAPDVVINAAAWTNVDGAEANPQAAWAVNALGARHLAQGCAAVNALFCHVSTNEVFAGLPGRFYFEDDLQQPGSVYARSKAAGERGALAVGARLQIVRLAWLYGPGGQNFPTRILDAADKAAAASRPLRVVADEFGNPTSAEDAAQAMVRLLESARPGAYHLVNEGFCSRFDFAQAVLQSAGREHVALERISSADYVRAAPPPAHAVLVNAAAAALGINLRPWQDALADYVASLAPAQTGPFSPSGDRA